MTAKQCKQMNETTDILIAGAGPVGLSLAIALARQGIAVTVLEKEAELSSDARASTIHPPTLEMFAEWGFGEEVIAKGRVIDRLQFWERSRRELVAEFPYALIANDTPYPCRFQCPQSTVIRVILPHLLRYEKARVLFEHELQRFTDHGTHITAEVATPDGVQQWQAKYLVGADGSRSQVRACLGLGFTGKTYEDRFLLVACDLDLSPYFPAMGPVAYLFDPEEWVIVMHLPNLTRLVFQLRADEDAAEAMAEPNIRARIARFLGAEAAYNISGITNYNVHQRVTDRFRVGRVLLAGDAAHINNPTGGMGMNSGIHDAHHLAKALTAVLRGEADAVLDEYAEARRRVATESVQNTSNQSYVNLTVRDARARDERDRELREIAADSIQARAFLLQQAMLTERI
jgi:3-(3-hydroxy-phenyl)propionate hydroxylase